MSIRTLAASVAVGALLWTAIIRSVEVIYTARFDGAAWSLPTRVEAVSILAFYAAVVVFLSADCLYSFVSRRFAKQEIRHR
ncbi:MAG TPA: hypothetical protein VNG29_04570 [Candidatus Paceibacterota bacterium]|nr:hypothetical protein [Candidatus Paceibacterota bacterium]